MAIVLNEYEWAERMIANRDLGAKPGETLSRVAKYYFENRYSKREVRKLLDQFLMQCNPDASLVHWSDALDKIVKTASRFPLIQIDYVYVSPAELSRIEELGNKQLKRLAFTMLCVVKYWNAVSANNNNWLNAQDKDIFQMANITVPSKKHDLMYGALREAGFIRLSKRIDNLNVQILFADEEEPEDVTNGILVRDFRNLGYQYMKYHGEAFFECESCGLTVRSKERAASKTAARHGFAKPIGRRQKYCPSCAMKIKTRQNVAAVMRRRNSDVK